MLHSALPVSSGRIMTAYFITAEETSVSPESPRKPALPVYLRLKTHGFSKFGLVLWLSVQNISCAAQERSLPFPTDFERASISIHDAPKLADNLTGHYVFDFGGRSVGIAKGEISVPENAFVGLKLNSSAGYMDFLANLPKEGIQQIELNGASLSDELFRYLERIGSLRKLALNKCKVDANLDSTMNQGCPQLQQLTIYLDSDATKEQTKAAHRQIVHWASKSPKLQFLLGVDKLKLEDARRFRRHEAPLFLSVAFDDDAHELINILGEIPNLIGLNITIDKHAPQDFHCELPKLKQLELFNWSGGNLNAELVESLEKMDSLRTARFQGRLQVSDEFIVAIPRLGNLESFSLRSSLSDSQQRQFNSAMMKMKGIRDLPKLKNPSANLLKQLLNRQNLKTIRISGLGEDANPKQIADVVTANPSVRWIDISDLSFTSEIGAAVSGCRQLETLHLSVFDFDGRLIKRADSLNNLKKLVLEIKGTPSNLSTISEFPSLRSIQISFATLNPDDWSFIAEAKSLRSLSIKQTYCDDSIVKWIKQNKNLRSFTASQDCLFTDAGVLELCECKHMESLSIGGFISAASIERLGHLPNLSRLNVASDLPNEKEKEELTERLGHLEHFSLRELYPTAGTITIGHDGLYRRVYDEGRKNFDAMEGKTLEDLFGHSLTEASKKQLDGKVVLVEFWGTWCGPCLNYVPELERLKKQYGEKGFQIVSVHSKAEADTAEAYIESHPKPWLNLIDHDGTIEKSFEVASFPSLYLFGKDGTLKVAQPHRMGLDRSLEKLLKGKSKNKTN